MSTILSWLMQHLEGVSVAVLDAVLMLIPSLKSNNVLQLVGNALKSLSDAIGTVVNPQSPSNPPSPPPAP